MHNLLSTMTHLLQIGFSIVLSFGTLAIFGLYLTRFLTHVFDPKWCGPLIDLFGSIVSIIGLLWIAHSITFMSLADGSWIVGALFFSVVYVIATATGGAIGIFLFNNTWNLVMESL